MWRRVAAGGAASVTVMFALWTFGANAAFATVPDPPTNVIAAASDGQASVSFTAPVNQGTSAVDGYTVTASPGNESTQGSGSPITVSGLQDGTSYTFTVTASNSDGPSAASTASTPVTPLAAPTLSAPPMITGTADIDDTLSVSTGTWNNDATNFTYQWSDCDPTDTTSCDAIDGATSDTYTVTPFDAGFVLTVMVTATNPDDEAGTAMASSPTATVVAQPGAPALVTAPTTGDQLGSATRVGSAGTWTNNPTSFAYFWVSCTLDVSDCNLVGGDQASYTPTTDDAGNVLYLEVVATNAAGDSEVAISDPSEIVSFLPPPTIDITSPGQGANFSPLSAAPTAAYTCSPGAGAQLASCVGSVPYGAPITLGSDSESFTVTATDTDGQTSTQTVTYSVGSAPAISVPSPASGAVYTQGQSVASSFSCTASDGGTVNGCTAVQAPACPPTTNSGLAPGTVVVCGGSFKSGALLDTTNIGTHTVTITAYETYPGSLGNSALSGPLATKTVNYTVIPASTASVSLVVGNLGQATGHWRLASKGTKFTFTSNQAAVVTFTFHRLLGGRKAGGRCVAQTASNRRRPKCTRSTAAGTLTHSEPAGNDSVAFKGVVGHAKLSPGNYSVTITAVPAGGASSSADQVGTLHFTVAK